MFHASFLSLNLILSGLSGLLMKAAVTPRGGPLVLQAVPLEDLDHQNVGLQLGKSPPNAAPRSVAEGDVTEGVSLVVGLVTSEPSLRQELLRLAVLTGGEAGDEDPVDDAGPGGDLVVGEHEVPLSPPARPVGHRHQSEALLTGGPEVFHPPQRGLRHLPPGPHRLPDLLVQQLLLLRVGGQLVEQEGGGGPGRVDPGHHGVHGHDGGDVPAVPAPLHQLLQDAPPLSLPASAVLLEPPGSLLDILAAGLQDLCGRLVNFPGGKQQSALA